MKYFFTFFALLSTTFIFSQAVITGTIRDGEFNDPLPFANVILKTADGKQIWAVAHLTLTENTALKLPKEVIYSNFPMWGMAPKKSLMS